MGGKAISETEQPRPDGPPSNVRQSTSWTKACVRGQRVLFPVKIKVLETFGNPDRSTRLVAAVTAMYNTPGLRVVNVQNKLLGTPGLNFEPTAVLITLAHALVVEFVPGALLVYLGERENDLVLLALQRLGALVALACGARTRPLRRQRTQAR